MEFEFTQFSRHVFKSLERMRIPYMLTGSVAIFHYAEPRSTNDVDVVIDPSEEQLEEFLSEFQEVAMAEREPALDAFRRRSMFNIICYESAEKMDLILLKEHAYDRTAFHRRKRVKLAGFPVNIVTAEDLILGKLRWARHSLSELQLRDVSGLMGTQKEDLDWKYLDHWVKELVLDQTYTISKREAGVFDQD